MVSKNERIWREFVQLLKDRLPTRHFVAVRRVEMRDLGSTSLSDSERLITVSIRKSDTLRAQMDTLVHEWGHVLQYDRIDWHGDEWGKFQASAYRVLESFIDAGLKRPEDEE